MKDGEIAERLLGYKGKHDGITISLGNARQLGSIAKEMDIPKDELLDYVRKKLHKLVDEIYSPKNK